MKEIRTIKMVERTEVKFVADDGKEFIGENAEKECKAYERRMNEDVIKKEFNKLNGVKISIPAVNLFYDEAEFWKITLNSKKDYITMTDYFETIYYCNCCYMEEPREYPYTMIAVVGYDWYDEYRNNLKAELQKAIEQLDKEIKV